MVEICVSVQLGPGVHPLGLRKIRPSGIIHAHVINFFLFLIFACYCDRVLGHRYLLWSKIFTGPFLPLDLNK